MTFPHTSMAIVASLVLTACGAGVTSTTEDSQTGNGTASLSPLNIGMPRSMRQSDEREGANKNIENARNAKAASDVTRESNAEMSEVISNQDSYSVPVSTLFVETDMLYGRLQFTRYQLEDLGKVWQQIVSNCSAIANGATCSIPAGTLTIEGSSDDENDASYVEFSEYLTETDIEYVRTPGDKYDHTIVFNDSFEDSDKVSEEYRWNEDQSRILSKMNGEWHYEETSGTFATSFAYAETDKGSEITFIEESKESEYEHKLSMQLRELGGEKNDVEAQTQSRWVNAGDKGTSTSNVVANDDGGRLGSTSEYFFTDGSSEKIHSRHTFNGKSELTSAEYCNEAEGIDCSKAENWEKVDESELINPAQLSNNESDVASREEALDVYELTDEEFAAMLENLLAVEEGNEKEEDSADAGEEPQDSEIDWEITIISEELIQLLGEENMDSDFFNACQEMGMSESDCEFGEILTLEGTDHSIENVKDSYGSVCQEMGISKEDCPI